MTGRTELQLNGNANAVIDGAALPVFHHSSILAAGRNRAFMIAAIVCAARRSRRCRMRGRRSLRGEGHQRQGQQKCYRTKHRDVLHVDLCSQFVLFLSSSYIN